MLIMPLNNCPIITRSVRLASNAVVIYLELNQHKDLRLEIEIDHFEKIDRNYIWYTFIRDILYIS